MTSKLELERSHVAGKTLKIKDDVPKIGGLSFEVEDWWKNINGKSWMVSDGNPVCLTYAMRINQQNLPMDDDVLYGRINDSIKGLMHLSELVID